ncbi:SMP-30/gluconolactonase/LRE family protein [bacterium]|nr:SMP-30/gluconolactonase/LRE family protein [bacterium]
MKKLHLIALLAVSFSMGCAALPSVLSPAQQGHVMADGQAVLQLQPQLQGGGYAAQAVVKTNHEIVDHLVVELFTMGANSQELVIKDKNDQPLTKTIAHADLGQPITFSHLKSKTTYRIKATAYDAANQVVSRPFTIDVPVNMDDRPTVQTLAITLLDKPFSGTGTSSISILDGGLNASGASSISAILGPNITTYYANATASVGAVMFPQGTLAFISQDKLYTLSKTGTLTLSRAMSDIGYGGNRPTGEFTGLTYRTINGGEAYVVGPGLAGNVNVGNSGGSGYSFSPSSETSIQPISSVWYVPPTDQYKRYHNYILDKRKNAILDTWDNNAVVASHSFNVPSAIAADKDGNFYVADTGNNVIKTFNITATESVRTISGFSAPKGVAVDSDGIVWVADTGNHAIKKIDKNGNVTTYAGGTQGNADGRKGTALFNGPTGLCFDASGSLWVADTGNNSIRRINFY